MADPWLEAVECLKQGIVAHGYPGMLLKTIKHLEQRVLADIQGLMLQESQSKRVRAGRPEVSSEAKEELAIAVYFDLVTSRLPKSSDVKFGESVHL